jgi:DNA/RNA endonuclease YhcR with UshA esterase domain
MHFYKEITIFELPKILLNMNKLILAAFLFITSSISLSAQTKITPDEAAKHIGDSVTVCGKIFGGKYFDRGENKITLLNMGAAYPQSPLTIVIEPDSRKNFSNKPEEFYTDKQVCITGVVKEYKGKPQIIIAKEADVEVQK